MKNSGSGEISPNQFREGCGMTKQVQLLIFSLDDRSYGLHLAQVNRVVRSVDCTPLPAAPDIVLGVIDFHGRIVPLLNIRKRFGIAEKEIGLDDQFIVASTSKRTVALAVDRVKSVVERPAAEIVAAKKILHQLDQIEGVIQLPDELTLIHDLDRFLSLDEESALTQAMRMEPIHG
jgi:purine-binding chemotaxis protein CheW